MPRWRFTALFLALLGILALLSLSHAQTKVLTAEATYTMGDGESPSFAEAQVLQRAKQIALEQAGTYVESYTKVHNYDLTTEEIQTLAGGVLEVEVLEKIRMLVGDGLRFSIKIKATVTTDKMEELARRIKGKNVAEEYKKLQEEYARLSEEIETWKRLVAKSPSGPERELALDQIREREKAFSTVQEDEVALFQRLISGQALMSRARQEKTGLDGLMRKVREHGHSISIGKVTATHAPGESVDLVVTIPISVQSDLVMMPILSDAVREFNGEISKLSTSGNTFTYYLPKSSADRIINNNKTLESFKVSSVYPLLPSHFETYFRRMGRNSGSNETVVSITLSRTKALQELFWSRVRKIGVDVQLHLSGGDRRLCRVPFIVNRILAISGRSEPGGDVRYDVNYYDLGSRAGLIEDPVKRVFLLRDKTSFEVRFVLEPDEVEKLGRVTAEAVETDAAHAEFCRVTLQE